MELGQRNQAGASQFEQLGRQSAPGFAERLRTDGAATPAMLNQCTKQRIKFGLHAGTPARHHQSGHAWQSQCAIGGKGSGRTTHAIGERRIKQECGELSQKPRGRWYLSSYR
ncbi:hypothetical protein [Paraburkholderia sp. BCC1886]|uniref:hypothetical protein n=1 Tax=Paraburkholderia sp. BCC1886 TaxID=2562670 RepID=UPI0021B32001|nr:hypothetical protein [Paraburkholderia sp. BCC1886]